MSAPPDRRIDAGDITLAWGNASAWKARLREESAAAWLERPIAERLRIALSMIRSPPPRASACADAPDPADARRPSDLQSEP